MTHAVDGPDPSAWLPRVPRDAGVTDRRAVVTGLGVVSPVGIGSEATWDGLVAGRSGIDRITLFDAEPFDVDVAGEVKGFEATRLHGPQGRAAPRPQHAPRGGGHR